MFSFVSVYSASLAISAMISTVIIVYVWQRRHVPGGTAFSLVMLATAIWSWTGFMEFMSVDPGTKIFWSKLSYLGVVNIAPLWFVFALRYTRRDQLVTPLRLCILWILPVLILAFTATNELHRMVWTSTTPIFEGFHLILKYSHGPIVWINMTYSYILLFLGTVTLIRFTLLSPLPYKIQTYALVLAAVVPWTGNIMYLTGVSPKPWIDMTPFAFMATGLLISWSIFRHQLLDLIPVAHDALFANMRNGVLVLDSSNRILDVNPAARDFLGLNLTSVGFHVEDVTPFLSEHYTTPTSDSPLHEVSLVNQGLRRWLSISITPLFDRQRNEAGRLVVMQDITDMKNTAEALRESEERWNFALEGSGNGVWDWDVKTDRVFYSKQWKEMLGYSDDMIGDSIGEWESRIHPEDVERVREDLRFHFVRATSCFKNEHRILCADGKYKWFLSRGKVINWSPAGQPLRMIGTNTDISARKNQETEREELIASLQKALSEIKTLQGLIPICSHCKKIRNDDGYWQQIEHYLYEHSGAEFTHGICPDCMRKYYADYMKKSDRLS